MPFICEINVQTTLQQHLYINIHIGYFLKHSKKNIIVCVSFQNIILDNNIIISNGNRKIKENH